MSATVSTAAPTMRPQNKLPILTKLYFNRGATTAKALDANSVALSRLEAEGKVRKVKAVEMTGKRGRPAHNFALTASGMSTVRAALKAGKVTEDGKYVG